MNSHDEMKLRAMLSLVWDMSKDGVFDKAKTINEIVEKHIKDEEDAEDLMDIAMPEIDMPFSDSIERKI